MFHTTALEATFVALWVLGIVAALALIFLRRLDLRTRLIVLIGAVVIPVIGSAAVIVYAVYAFSKRGGGKASAGS